MIEFNKWYFLKQRAELIEVHNKLRTIFRDTILQDEDLRTSNHARYELMLSKTEEWRIPEKFTLVEIIDFYKTSHETYELYCTLPGLISNLQNASLVNDLILYFEFLLPTLEDYRVIFSSSSLLPVSLLPSARESVKEKTAKKEKEKKGGDEKIIKDAKKILVEKKLYNFIVYFKLEDVASKLRHQIEIFPLRRNNYEILFSIQRFGLLPITNYEKIKPEKDASIIKLDYANPVVYNTASLKRQFQNVEGVSADYIADVVQPSQMICENTPAKITIKNERLIYETFDGVHFRKLAGNMKKYKRGPSGIALGYNKQFCAELEKKIGTPFATPDELVYIQSKNKLKFDTIIGRLSSLSSSALSADEGREKSKEKKSDEKEVDPVKKKIEEELRAYLVSQLNFVDISSFLKREINIGLELEMRRFIYKLERSTVENFIAFLRSEKSNIIFKIEQKIKMYTKMNPSSFFS